MISIVNFGTYSCNSFCNLPTNRSVVRFCSRAKTCRFFWFFATVIRLVQTYGLGKTRTWPVLICRSCFCLSSKLNSRGSRPNLQLGQDVSSFIHDIVEPMPAAVAQESLLRKKLRYTSHVVVAQIGMITVRG